MGTFIISIEEESFSIKESSLNNCFQITTTVFGSVSLSKTLCLFIHSLLIIISRIFKWLSTMFQELY